MKKEEFKQTRIALGLSQRKLARILERNVRTIQRYESGDLGCIARGNKAFKRNRGGVKMQDLKEVGNVNKESDSGLLTRLGTDGMKWSKEMHKRFPLVPQDDLLGWCCNMIMAGYDAKQVELEQDNTKLIEALKCVIDQVDNLNDIWDIRNTAEEAILKEIGKNKIPSGNIKP